MMTVPTTNAVTRAKFGELPDGTAVERIDLRTADGFEVRIITYGAALQALLVPDRHGKPEDVVLGFDDLAAYAVPRRYYGATVGRYANRIAGAGFELDGERFVLAANEAPNALHGGVEGFSRKIWSVVATEDGVAPAVTLACHSPDGEEGYPGALDVRATYRITAPGELSIDYSASTSRPTVISLTNHSFFNLDGAANDHDILSHRLTLHADSFLPISEQRIPLSDAPQSVAGTPFDFRDAQTIGARMQDADEQLKRGRGYDHNFCLHENAGLRLAATVAAPQSGRTMELHTNQPGLQFYSGNYLDGSIVGKYGRPHRQFAGLCLEPQNFPNAPNRPDFPSARLDPGETWRNQTLYRFSMS
jgi:aldose 1-epimerase